MPMDIPLLQDCRPKKQNISVAELYNIGPDIQAMDAYKRDLSSEFIKTGVKN